MPTYVAFLRAIYGEKMAPLRELLESLGFSNVDSFLASGNLIFDAASEDADAFEEEIEAALPGTLGYDVAVFVHSMDEVRRVAHRQPFPPEEVGDNDTLYVGFLKDAPDGDARETLLTYTTENDLIDVDGREVYWLCRTKSQESKFSGAIIEKTCGTQATMRNARTLRRIVAKYG